MKFLLKEVRLVSSFVLVEGANKDAVENRGVYTEIARHAFDTDLQELTVDEIGPEHKGLYVMLGFAVGK